MYNKFNFCNNKEKQQIFALQLTDKNGQQYTSDNQEEIENALHDYIKQHFQQPKMEGCPMMMDHFLDLFGHDANTEFSNSFISLRPITFPLSLSPLEKEIFEELKPLELSDVHAIEEISLEDIKSGYKNRKERTLTSPHGRHLGIYKHWLF